MKAHTQRFKEEIAKLGRQIKTEIWVDVTTDIRTEGSLKLIVTEDGDTLRTERDQTPGSQAIQPGLLIPEEDIYSVDLVKNGSLLKTLMMQCNLEIKGQLSIGSMFSVKLGVLVDNDYEFLDYGKFIVYSKEYNADTETWKHICYDKMLYAMKKYVRLNVSYPITVKNYINAIATKMGVKFYNAGDIESFTNCDKLIKKDYFVGKDVTYRDILDKLAEIIGSNILINYYGYLQIVTPEKAGELDVIVGQKIYIERGEDAKLRSFELEGNTTQDGTPSPDNPSELVSVGYENYFSSEIEVGSISGNDGQPFNQNDRLRTKDYISVLPNTTYTLSLKSEYNIQTYIFEYGNSYDFIQRIPSSWADVTYSFTTNANTKYIKIIFRKSNNAIIDVTDVANVILSKGTQAHSYIPYGKYGIEVKTTGKNLLDYEHNIIENSIIQTSSNKIVSTNEALVVWARVQPNAQYTLSRDKGDRLIIGASNTQPTLNGTLETIIYDGGTSEALTYTFTNGNYNYIAIYISRYNTSKPTKVQLEQGNTATTYEPYKSNTYLYQLDEPLRSIGNFKDILYIKDGYMYVQRKIGSVVLDGSENWSKFPSEEYPNSFGYRNDELLNEIYDGNYTGAYSNYFIMRTLTDLKTNNGFDIRYVSNYSRIEITNLLYTDVNDFKNWLSTHNTEVLYILNTPIIEELGIVTMPSTYKGVTYIDIPNTTEITYMKEFEELDETYLKDVNVNFGKYFGHINTLEATDSENKLSYTVKDDASIQQYGVNKINITNNPFIFNGEENEICNNILKAIKDIYYSINDFTTTGVCYYDYLDLFNIKVKDETYKCLLLNNEIKIEQGIEETIFTEGLNDTTTETDTYQNNYLSNKDATSKIEQLDNDKVSKNNILNSLNQSPEGNVIRTNKIFIIRQITGTTDSNGFLDVNLNGDYVLCNVIGNINGFYTPYYNYNNGSPLWKLKIENESRTAIANTQVTITMYYIRKEG